MHSMASQRDLMTFEGVVFAASRNTFLHFYCGDEDGNLPQRRPRRHSGPATSQHLERDDSPLGTLHENFGSTEMISESAICDGECSIDDGYCASDFAFETPSESLSAVAYRCFSARSSVDMASEAPSAFHDDTDGYPDSDESFTESSPQAMGGPAVLELTGSFSGAQGLQACEQQMVQDETDLNCHTVMLKNIPCACTQKEVLAAIDEVGFKHDFFYLPARRSKYLGYAFVGFPDPRTTQAFAKAITGYQFKSRTSLKTLEVVPARIQGVENKFTMMSRRGRRRPAFPGKFSKTDATEHDRAVEQ